MPRFSDRSLRFAMAALIIGALVLCIGTLVWRSVPDSSRELVASLTGGLLLLARDAARWVFPARDHQQENTP